MYLTAVDI